jgi:Skp family chaperone for outer membrane proteins
VSEPDVRLAIINAVLRDVATKDDIEALRAATKGDIESLRAATKSDMEALRKEFKEDLEALKSATKGDIEALRRDVKGDVESLRREVESLRRDVERNDPVQASEKLYKAAEEAVKALARRFTLPECKEAEGRGRWTAALLFSAVRGLSERVARRP